MPLEGREHRSDVTCFNGVTLGAISRIDWWGQGRQELMVTLDQELAEEMMISSVWVLDIFAK